MIVEHPQPEPAPRAAVSRARYAIIGAVVVLAVAIGAVLGGVLVASGAAPLARAAAYVPADAVMYAEVRLDLPGSQRENLRTLLERFPAADADAVLTDALAETLDQALARDGAPIDYSNDIASWFDGTLAMALLDYPLNTDPDNLRVPSLVGMFGVRDPRAAAAVAEQLRTEAEASGAVFASSEHGGITIWTLDVDTGDVPVEVQGAGFAYAVSDDQLLLANGATPIEAALDAAGGESMLDSDEVQRLLEALPEERVGVAVVRTAAMMAEMRAELEAVDPALAEALDGYLGAVPPVSAGALSFAADAVLVDSAAGRPDGPLQPQNSERDLALYVAAGAIFYADASQVGASLEQAIATMKATAALGPRGDDSLAELDAVEAALGAELEELVRWIGDGAVAVGWDGADPWIGLVLDAADPDAAAQRLNQLGAIAELASGEAEGELEVATETVDGVEVTTITIGGSLAREAGVDVPVAIEYALDDATALIGYGGFVRTAIGLDPGASLGESERYIDAVERFGGVGNAGTFLLDLAALRTTLEDALPVGAGVYEQVRPNLEPLDYVAGVTSVEGDRVMTRLGLVVR